MTKKVSLKTKERKVDVNSGDVDINFTPQLPASISTCDSQQLAARFWAAETPAASFNLVKLIRPRRKTLAHARGTARSRVSQLTLAGHDNIGSASHAHQR